MASGTVFKQPAGLKAIIFDVDGTLANTEEIHRQSFNAAFTEFGFNQVWSPAEYAKLLSISGGRERIAAWLKSQNSGFGNEHDLYDQARKIHRRKSAIYREHLRHGRITPRTGIVRLINEARGRGIRLGIATSTSLANVETLLGCILDQNARLWFDAIVTSDTVADKKPSPSVYQCALKKLGLPARDCIAIEDTTNGNRAAIASGIATVITIHEYTIDNDFTGASLVVDQLGEPDQPFRVIAGNARRKNNVDVDLLQCILREQVTDNMPQATGN